MMRRSLLLTLLVAVAMVAAAGSSSAQPKQGDVIFSLYSSTPAVTDGLYYKTWPSGSIRTLTSGITLATAKVPHSNSYVYSSGGSSGNIYRYDKSGVQYTMTTVTTNVTGIGVDQDGSHMITNSTDSKLYRLSGSSCTVWATLTTLYGSLNALCRDGNTGDWIVGTFGGSSSRLLRVSRTTKSVSAWTTLPTGVYGVDWIPQTGEFVVAMSGRLSFVRSNGTIRSTYTTTRLFNCVTVDQKTGRIFAGTNDGYVYEFTYTGSVVRASLVRSGKNISGIDIWDDQNLSIALYGSGSSSYARAFLRFNESPSRSYYVALSTAAYPGINLGASGWVNLQPNSLFFVTLGGGLPYFTSTFSGVLSTSGSAYARWVMPYGVTRVYVTAVAVNPAKPGGIDVGNVEVVDTW